MTWHIPKTDEKRRNQDSKLDHVIRWDYSILIISKWNVIQSSYQALCSCKSILLPPIHRYILNVVTSCNFYTSSDFLWLFSFYQFCFIWFIIKMSNFHSLNWCRHTKQISLPRIFQNIFSKFYLDFIFCFPVYPFFLGFFN